MAQAGIPLWEIASVVGHSDKRMVEKYYAHHHPDYQTRAIVARDRSLKAMDVAPHLHANMFQPPNEGRKASKSLKNCGWPTLGLNQQLLTMSTHYRGGKLKEIRYSPKLRVPKMRRK